MFVPSVSLSVCPSARNDLTPTGKNFVVFCVVFTKIYLLCSSLAEIRHKFLFHPAVIRNPEVIKLQTKTSSSSHADVALALTPPLIPSSFLRSIYSFTPSRCRKAAMAIPRCNLSFSSFTSAYFFLHGVLVSFRAMASPLPGFPHRWTFTR